MPTAKKSAAKKKAASTKTRSTAKTSWSDTIKSALDKKKQGPAGIPDQGKPRDSTVQKVKKDAF